MRRLMVASIALLVCCATAQAAPPAHQGRPVVAPPTGFRTLERLQAYRRTLVELDRTRAPAAVSVLRRAGAELIAPPLALWRLPSWTAQRVLPGLLRRGVVRSVTPDVPLGTKPADARGFFGFTDPLSSSEWWVSHVGADRWTAPGPGVPLTLIDSGVDLSHEEFAARPNTFPLNAMTYSGNEQELHGTATASVAAAPENGV